jgi:hypothetical protein
MAASQEDPDRPDEGPTQAKQLGAAWYARGAVLAWTRLDQLAAFPQR